MEKEILDILRRQEKMIANLMASQNAKLGWSDRRPNSKRWVFVNYDIASDTCAYYLNDNVREHIHQRCLTGYIVKLEKDCATRRDEESEKLNVYVKTDDITYVISAGYNTYFAKSLLNSIAAVDKSSFIAPVTIEMKPGNDPQRSPVVWCSLLAPDYVMADPINRNWDYNKVAAIAFKNINGDEAQDLPQQTVQQKQPTPKPTTKQTPLPKIVNKNHNVAIGVIRDYIGLPKDIIVSACNQMGVQSPMYLTHQNFKSLLISIISRFADDNNYEKHGTIANFDKFTTACIHKGWKYEDAAVEWFRQVTTPSPG